MSSVVTKFEVRLPPFDARSDQNQADIDTFTNGLAALSPVSSYQVYVENTDLTSHNDVIIHGLLTAPQATSALTLLNALNTALGTTTVCVSYPVTLQP